jgi:RNase P protein component
MLPAKNRAVTTPFFSLKTRSNAVGVNRIAVVVGLSVDKRAVRRNFWERQAQNQLLKAPQLEKDFILTIFSRVKTLTKRQFAQEIKNVLKKIDP